MSNFKMSVTFTEAEWNGLSEAHKTYWQRLVNETCDILPKGRSDAQYDHNQANAEGWGNQVTTIQSGV